MQKYLLATGATLTVMLSVAMLHAQTPRVEAPAPPAVEPAPAPPAADDALPPGADDALPPGADDALPPGAEPIPAPAPATTTGTTTANKIPASDLAPLPNHPLLPALEYSRKLYEAMGRNIRDYTCVLVRRERIDGELSEYEYLAAKISERRTGSPFSVYLSYLAPEKFKGREVLYVENERDGEMLVRNGGARFDYITAVVPPTSAAAMRSSRYPVTAIGLRNLMDRLLTQGARDMHYQECKVEYFDNAKVNGRQCLHIRVTHPIERPHFLYNHADIFIDKKLKVVVRYTSHSWPRKPGGEPLLLEEYNYLNIRLNVGLAPTDFDEKNPAYAFYRRLDEPAASAATESKVADAE